jgi:DNA polymerase-3 subunit beta
MLQVLNTIIPANPIIPSLENVLVDVEGETISMTASDGEIFATIKNNELVKEGEDFNVLLPAKLLGELSKGLPLQPVTIELTPYDSHAGDNEEVMISSSSGSYVIQIADVTEYVSILEFEDDDNSIDLFTSHIITGIEDVLFAAANDDLRPAMSGINIYIDTFLVKMVATDGYILAEKKFVTNEKMLPAGNFKDFTISQKAAKCLLKMLKLHAGEMVSVLVTETHVQISSDTMTFACRLISDKYPDYRAIMPESFSHECKFVRLDLFASLKRVALFAEKQKTGAVAIEFKGHDSEEMTVSASKEDFSLYANEAIPCFFRGNPLRISFLANKMAAILDNMSHYDVIMRLTSPKSAIGLYGQWQDEDKTLTYIIMPVVDND